MKRVKRIRALAVGVGLAGVLAACAVGVKAPDLTPEAEAALVDKGAYLTIAGDCRACHTRTDGEAFAGGRGLNTPFGVIYTPNITPDSKTGIGDWSYADFRRAMHHGQRPNGANLYPAFPYTAYTQVTDADSDAIFAYLKTLTPVSYVEPKHELGFPFNIRLLLRGWNLLNFRGGRFEPNPDQTAEWNRGAYLVEGLGHCGSCHTPKNMIGGDQSKNHLRGGTLEGWFASDLSNDPTTGIGKWTEQDIVDFLSTGANSYSNAYGTMSEVVRLSTSQMTPEDLMAMAVYLKSRPAPTPRPLPAPVAADDPAMIVGQRVFAANCVDCHLDDGSGIPTIYPPLAANSNVHALDPSSIIHVLLEGTGTPENPTANGGEGMQAFANLTDEEIAAVATYIRNSWGNAAPAVKPRLVADERALLKIQEPGHRTVLAK